VEEVLYWNKTREDLPLKCSQENNKHKSTRSTRENSYNKHRICETDHYNNPLIESTTLVDLEAKNHMNQNFEDGMGE
jgi:hypothetical protein